MSCSPLPKDEIFKNPLNHCQDCICNIVKSTIHHEEVQITCWDRHKCSKYLHTSTNSDIFINKKCMYADAITKIITKKDLLLDSAT